MKTLFKILKPRGVQVNWNGNPKRERGTNRQRTRSRAYASGYPSTLLGSNRDQLLTLPCYQFCATLMSACLLICFSGTAVVLAEKPNVIFMLADDLGYGDLSSYNPKSKGVAPNNTPIRTPNLGRMAKNGCPTEAEHVRDGQVCPSYRQTQLS